MVKATCHVPGRKVPHRLGAQACYRLKAPAVLIGRPAELHVFIRACCKHFASLEKNGRVALAASHLRDALIYYLDDRFELLAACLRVDSQLPTGVLSTEQKRACHCHKAGMGSAGGNLDYRFL